MVFDVNNIRSQVAENSGSNPFEFKPIRIGEGGRQNNTATGAEGVAELAAVGQELILPTEEASDQVVNDLQTKVAELKVENLELRVQLLEEKGIDEGYIPDPYTVPDEEQQVSNAPRNRGKPVNIDAYNQMTAQCNPAAAQNNAELDQARADLDAAKQELASLQNPEAGGLEGERPSSEELTEELFGLIEENKQLQVDNKQLEFDILTKELNDAPPNPCEGTQFEDMMAQQARNNGEDIRTRGDIQRDLSAAERELNEAIANQETNTSDDLRVDMERYEGYNNEDNNNFSHGYGRMLTIVADGAINDSKLARRSYLSDKIDKLEAIIVDTPEPFPMAQCEEQDTNAGTRTEIAAAQQEFDSLSQDLGL